MGTEHRAFIERMQPKVDAIYDQHPVRPAPVELRPLVLVDITGGLETASYLYPGTGEPELRIFDLDDETDEQDRLADELDELARLIRERSDHPDDLYAATRYEAEAAHVRHRMTDTGEPETYLPRRVP